jgi:Tetratricopeptide repeat
MREGPLHDAPPRPDDASQSFGNYVLHDRIGAGGMAEVFRAVVCDPEGLNLDRVMQDERMSHREHVALIQRGRGDTTMNARTLVMLTAVLLSPAGLGSLAASAVQAADPPAGNHPSAAEQQARADFARGDAAYKNGQYAQAVTEFEAGYALAPRPGFILNIALAWRKLGNLHKARAYYKKYLLIEPDSKFRPNVTALIAELDTALADEDRAAAVAVSTPANRAPSGGATGVATSAATPPTTAPSSALSAPAPAAPAPEVTLLAPASPSLAAPTSTSPGSASGVYRRPLFWVAVGVVVAGAALGLVLWQRSGGGEFHAAGDLGSIGP